MKLNDTTNGKARPDQVRMSNSMHVVSEGRHSSSTVPILTGMMILVVVVTAGVVFGADMLSSYLGDSGHSPVPSVLAAGPTPSAQPRTLTATVAVSDTVAAPTAGMTPEERTETVPDEASASEDKIETAAPATPSAEEVEEAATPTRPPATPAQVSEPEDTPTWTAKEAAEATICAPWVSTAVAATLTAMPTIEPSPTPDAAATATAEFEKIATAVAATLTAIAGEPVTGTVGTAMPVATSTVAAGRTVTATVTVTVTTTVTASPGPETCVNNASYLADVTIPDNTRLQPGEAFTKTWSMKNSGTCEWDETYRVSFARHSQMGGPDQVPLAESVAAGSSTEISVPMVAPETPGTYTGVWQLTDGQGALFDEVMTVVIQVPGADGKVPGSAAGSSDNAALLDIKPPDVKFGYGIQAHMWDADMGPVVSAVSNMGFGWVKQQTPWTVMEPENGNYQWGNTDRIVGALVNTGLKPMFSVVKSPEWARPPTTDFAVEGPPADPNEFAEFLGAMAGHYKGKVKAYEVWNEQNLHYEWGNEELDPARYMTLLKLAYAAIKAADPNAVVISGALTPTGAPPPWAIDDLQYLEAMYQNGLKEASDAIGAHPSGYNVPPDADWQMWQREGLFFQGPVNNRHHSWSFKATMEGYRSIMLQYGDENKTIWPTEFGWASSSTPVANYEYAADNSLDQQAQYTVQAYRMGKAWGWVGTMFLWNLNFKVVSPGSEMAQWGIVDQHWGGLPAYNALASMPK